MAISESEQGRLLGGGGGDDSGLGSGGGRTIRAARFRNNRSLSRSNTANNRKVSSDSGSNSMDPGRALLCPKWLTLFFAQQIS
jgi:hypothetical protein